MKGKGGYLIIHGNGILGVEGEHEGAEKDGEIRIKIRVGFLKVKSIEEEIEEQ